MEGLRDRPFGGMVGGLKGWIAWRISSIARSQASPKKVLDIWLYFGSLE
jgi:hypothetical protein